MEISSYVKINDLLNHIQNKTISNSIECIESLSERIKSLEADKEAREKANAKVIEVLKSITNRLITLETFEKSIRDLEGKRAQKAAEDKANFEYMNSEEFKNFTFNKTINSTKPVCTIPISVFDAKFNDKYLELVERKKAISDLLEQEAIKRAH